IEFTKVFQILDAKLIKENNQKKLREIENLKTAIKLLPKIARDHDLTSSLLVLHKYMGKLDQFDPNLFDKTFNKCYSTDDDKVFQIIISNAHEQARKEFIDYIERIEKMGASSDQIIQLSCIVLAISSVILQTVQHNKMTKLLAIIRRNLSSFGDFCDMPYFSTCFNRESSTPIDYQRFNEDSQIIAYAFRVYNQIIIQNLPEYLLAGNVIIPLMHIDIELEEFVDSYRKGQFSKSKAKKLTSLKRFWRLDQSSAYEVLRDIDFYIKVFGIQLVRGNFIIPPSLDKFLKLSDERKKEALKVLDPILYQKDEDAEKRAIIAKRSGASSYIGADGLPVFILKSKQDSKKSC
ncbi:hypothetical protein G6Z92_18730, partial [Vibrio aestuarianus subsp. cardii]|nr:hypothetical protein [Vibrio aestuarianus subsp. cardii]